MSNEDDYKIGYGRPPKHSQFRKGQSGNPKGRRKKQRKPPNIEAGLIKALSETATVTENGVRFQLTKFEAACKQLANKAASGHAPTIRLLLPVFMRMAQQSVATTPPAATAEDNSAYEKLCEMLGLPPDPESDDPPPTPA